MRVPLELIEKAAREYAPSKEEIQKIRQEIASKDVIALDGQARVDRRKEMIADVAIENVDDAFERYIGNNDLLPINYLLLGYLQSKSVGLIRYFDKREGKEAVATGFLIA